MQVNFKQGILFCHLKYYGIYITHFGSPYEIKSKVISEKKNNSLFLLFIKKEHIKHTAIV